MNKILLIGNSGLKKHGEDGQTIKVRLYHKKMVDEGFVVSFVDLENFTKRPLRTLLNIKKRFKECDRIVLITASRGCKFLIPFVNLINKKENKPFVLPLIGISVLHNSLSGLSIEKKQDFLVNRNYSLAKTDLRMAKQLEKITYILPETDLLVDTFRNFYKLDNVRKLNNFRDIDIDLKPSSSSKELRLVFLSRVMTIKGIFDLLKITKEFVEEGHLITLDIFGNKTMTKEEDEMFRKLINDKNVRYNGPVDNVNVSKTLANYDLFVFPTRYIGEGTPGVISESLIVGTPILTTNFIQAKYLLKDGVDSIFCKMFDKEDLKSKLLYIINNKYILENLRKGALESGKKYTYKHERKTFLKYVCGVEEE